MVNGDSDGNGNGDIRECSGGRDKFGEDGYVLGSDCEGEGVEI